MRSQPLKIDRDSQRLLAEISKQSGAPITEVLKTAIDEEYRRWFFKKLTRQYAKAKADPAAWAEELAERKLFEGTLMDGLREEGCYDDPRVAKCISRTSAKASGTNKKASARRS